MNNSSQLFLFLLNIYFNVGMISPFFQKQNVNHFSSMASELNFFTTEHEDALLENSIDNIMFDYVRKLKQIRATKDDAQAIALINEAKYSLMKRAQKLAPQIKNWKQSLSLQEAKKFNDALLVKPYFKEINDLVLNYSFIERLDKNAQLKQAFADLDDFLGILYN